eukprot:320552-Chlamydomonas_euryale.AAC.10
MHKVVHVACPYGARPTPLFWLKAGAQPAAGVDAALACTNTGMNGKCAMTTKYERQFTILQQNMSSVRAHVGVAQLPGSTWIW